MNGFEGPDVVALTIAGLALAISFWQAWNSRSEYKRARPAVGLTAGFYTCIYVDGRSAPGIMVNLSNTGREPTQVATFLVTDTGPEGPTLAFAINGRTNLRDGPPLPHMLAGHAMESWVISAKDVPEDVDVLQVSVTLGHGEVLKTRVTRDAPPSEVSDVEVVPRH